MNVILRHHCCCCRVSLVTTLYWLIKNSRNYDGITKYKKSNMVYCLMIRIMKIVFGMAHHSDMTHYSDMSYHSDVTHHHMK